MLICLRPPEAFRINTPRADSATRRKVLFRRLRISTGRDHCVYTLLPRNVGRTDLHLSPLGKPCSASCFHSAVTARSFLNGGEKESLHFAAGLPSLIIRTDQTPQSVGAKSGTLEEAASCNKYNIFGPGNRKPLEIATQVPARSLQHYFDNPIHHHQSVESPLPSHSAAPHLSPQGIREQISYVWG